MDLAEDLELDEPLEQPQKPKPPFAQIASIFAKPRQTLHWLAGQPRSVWFWPLVFISLAVIISALLMMQARGRASMAPPEFGPNAQYMTEEQRGQITQAASARSGILFTLILPALGGVLGVWLGWVLLGSLLNLSITMMGGAGNFFNLAAFSALPQIIRHLVMGLGVAISGKPVSSPGLAGFVSPDGSPLIRAMLGQIDLYWFWQFALLLAGAAIISKLPKTKAWLVVTVCFLLVLVLQSVPAFLGSKLSGLSTGGFSFF